MLNLNELRVFVAAAETENFSAAGRRLGMTQPAVSQHIRSLEKRFDIELFQRHGRHVSITDSGRVLAPMARDLLARGHRLEETMESLHGEVVGLLKVGCTTASGKYVLPRIFAGFRAAHPLVGFECLVSDRGRALAQLHTGEVQLAMTSVREPIKGIEYRPFLTDHIVLITRPDHPWAQGTEPVAVSDLPGEPFVSREEGSGTVDSIREGLALHDIGLEELPVSMVLSNSEAVRMAVAEGIGIGFVSAMVAAEAVAAGSVSLIQVEDFELTRTLFMARAAGQPATGAQAAFWDYAFSPATEEIRHSTASVAAATARTSR